MFKPKKRNTSPSVNFSDSTTSADLTSSTISIDSFTSERSPHPPHGIFTSPSPSPRNASLVETPSESVMERARLNLDPGIQQAPVDQLTLEAKIPLLSEILDLIHGNYLRFIPREKRIHYEIVPTLVGGAANLFHPAIDQSDLKILNDIDIEVFCHLRGATSIEISEFMNTLTQQFIPEYFGRSFDKPSVDIRTTSCQLVVFDKISVDVKFTVFTGQSLHDAIHESMISRRICPKANILRLSWYPTGPASIYYFPLWLDFTTNTLATEIKVLAPESIAYGLVFHALNTDFPITNRFQRTIERFNTAIETNPALRKQTVKLFHQLYLKKKQRPDDAYEQEFNQTINELLFSERLEVIELQAPQEVRKQLDNPPPAHEAPAARAASPHTLFFENYREIDSFCDAVIRQMKLLAYHGLSKLGNNPLIQLKRNLEEKGGKQSMAITIKHFNQQYPDINLQIIKHIPIGTTNFHDKSSPQKNHPPSELPKKVDIFLFENLGNYSLIGPDTVSKKEIDDLEMSMSALRMEFRATLGF